MLEKTTLSELKSKMPRGFLLKTINKYQEVYGESVSRKTIYRFFNGESYSNELHNVILMVADEKNILLARTQQVING